MLVSFRVLVSLRLVLVHVQVLEKSERCSALAGHLDEPVVDALVASDRVGHLAPSAQPVHLLHRFVHLFVHFVPQVGKQRAEIVLNQLLVWRVDARQHMLERDPLDHRRTPNGREVEVQEDSLAPLLVGARRRRVELGAEYLPIGGQEHRCVHVVLHGVAHALAEIVARRRSIHSRRVEHLDKVALQATRLLHGDGDVVAEPVVQVVVRLGDDVALVGVVARRGRVRLAVVAQEDELDVELRVGVGHGHVAVAADVGRVHDLDVVAGLQLVYQLLNAAPIV